MDNKFLHITVAVPLILLVFAGCNVSGDSPGQSESSSLPVHIVRADLASGVLSVEGLAEHGQLAVLATAQSSRQESNTVDPAIVATIQLFTVDEVVWGEVSETSIEVEFTGGIVNDAAEGPYLLELEGQPQFSEQQQYFLVLLGANPDGTYMLLGGPQGRYEVIDGRLHGVKGVDDPVVSSLDGTQFRTTAQELARVAQ